MLTYSEFFVALWCFPVVLFIIIPLAMFTFWMLGLASRKSFDHTKVKESTEGEEIIIITGHEQPTAG